MSNSWITKKKKKKILFFIPLFVPPLLSLSCLLGFGSHPAGPGAVATSSSLSYLSSTMTWFLKYVDNPLSRNSHLEIYYRWQMANEEAREIPLHVRRPRFDPWHCMVSGVPYSQQQVGVGRTNIVKLSIYPKTVDRFIVKIIVLSSQKCNKNF